MRNLLGIAAVGLMATSALAACGSDAPGSASSGVPRVGILLPDAKSSQRWTKDMALFRTAFAALGVRAQIENAAGDPAQFVQVADNMIDGGVKVLIISNLDSSSARTVLRHAREKKVPTIDYDRLTLNGGADFVVSFDNERIGELQAYGLTKCLRLRNVVRPMVAELNGSSTDGNATFLKAGYDFVLQAHYDSGEYRKGPDQFVPGWSAEQGTAVFQQMFEQQPRINGVLAANDDIAGAVIAVLKKRGLNGKVPVTGQDATVVGLRNVLSGDQCLTIYKRVKSEAYTAASLAAKLFRGEEPKVGGTLEDPESGAAIPFASIPPVAIEAAEVKDVVAEGYVSKDQLCTPAYQALCQQFGIE